MKALKERLKQFFKIITDILLAFFEWQTKKFWICLFLSLIAVTWIMKLKGVDYISDTFALGAMAYISAIIGLKDWAKKNKK